MNVHRSRLREPRFRHTRSLAYLIFSETEHSLSEEALDRHSLTCFLISSDTSSWLDDTAFRWGLKSSSDSSSWPSLPPLEDSVRCETNIPREMSEGKVDA